MATDPHVDRDQPEQGDEQRDDDERRDREESRKDVNPAFQRVADEIGRRFRKALDKLA